MVTILKEGLSKRKIDHIEKWFRDEDGISGITTDHFVRLIYIRCIYIPSHIAQSYCPVNFSQLIFRAHCALCNCHSFIIILAHAQYYVQCYITYTCPTMHYILYYIYTVKRDSHYNLKAKLL